MKAHRHPVAALAAGIALALASMSCAAVEVSVTGLVTDDQTANAAQITDPTLLNGWGISMSPTSPFWVSSNGGGVSEVYRVDPVTQAVTKAPLTVAIPGAGNPTGQVFNSGAGAGQFNGNAFLFVSEDGTVSGWRGSLGTTAETLATASSAIYKGSALATIGGDTYLYAADFHNGGIAVFKGTSGAPALSGSFVDPSLPSGFAPFNVQMLGGSLFVTYAEQTPGSGDETAGPGLGFVDRYDLQGNLLGRVASGGVLNAPWGLAIAPSSFGALAGTLLVGNFGDGRISAYDLSTNSFVGQLDGTDGNPLAIEGLWGLSVGNDGGAGSSQDLYFSAGPGDESHGLFGVLVAVPEPPAALLLALGLVGLLGRRAAPQRLR
jgi:uncharacterized protein (TIGR03118 family)